MNSSPVTVMVMQSSFGGPFHAKFDVVYRATVSFVRRVVRRQPIPPADRDDVVQDVFVIAYRRWGQLESEQSLRAWLHSIAVRTCWNYQRAHRRWSRRFSPASDELEERIAADAVVVDQQLALQEELRKLGEAVARLDDKRRESLVLSRLEGRSATEVSRLTGLSPNTVSSRIRAALFELREYLSVREASPAARDLR